MTMKLTIFYGPVFLICKKIALFAIFYWTVHNFFILSPRDINVYAWLTRNQEEDGPENQIELSYLSEEQ